MPGTPPRPTRQREHLEPQFVVHAGKANKMRAFLTSAVGTDKAQDLIPRPSGYESAAGRIRWYPLGSVTVLLPQLFAHSPGLQHPLVAVNFLSRVSAM